jgi:hypothetical protein
VIVEVAVAGREVVLLVEQRIVRNVHLAIDAEQRPVGIDDRSRVPIDPRRLPLEHGNDDDDGELAREALHRLRARARNRLRQIEAIALLRLAEVERVIELLEADDLRAARRRLADQTLGAADVLADVRAGMVLNDSDREWAVHGNDVLSLKPKTQIPNPKPQNVR